MPQQKTAAESMADWMKRRTDKAARLFRRHHDTSGATKPANGSKPQKEKKS